MKNKTIITKLAMIFLVLTLLTVSVYAQQQQTSWWQGITGFFTRMTGWQSADQLRAQCIEVDAPDTINADQRISFKVKIKNIGTSEWLKIWSSAELKTKINGASYGSIMLPKDNVQPNEEVIFESSFSPTINAGSYNYEFQIFGATCTKTVNVVMPSYDSSNPITMIRAYFNPISEGSTSVRLVAVLKNNLPKDLAFSGNFKFEILKNGEVYKTLEKNLGGYFRVGFSEIGMGEIIDGLEEGVYQARITAQFSEDNSADNQAMTESFVIGSPPTEPNLAILPFTVRAEDADNFKGLYLYNLAVQNKGMGLNYVDTKFDVFRNGQLYKTINKRYDINLRAGTAQKLSDLLNLIPGKLPEGTYSLTVTISVPGEIDLSDNQLSGDAGSISLHESILIDRVEFGENYGKIKFDLYIKNAGDVDSGPFNIKMKTGDPWGGRVLPDLADNEGVKVGETKKYIVEIPGLFKATHNILIQPDNPGDISLFHNIGKEFSFAVTGPERPSEGYILTPTLTLDTSEGEINLDISVQQLGYMTFDKLPVMVNVYKDSKEHPTIPGAYNPPSHSKNVDLSFRKSTSSGVIENAQIGYGETGYASINIPNIPDGVYVIELRVNNDLSNTKEITTTLPHVVQGKRRSKLGALGGLLGGRYDVQFVSAVPGNVYEQDYRVGYVLSLKNAGSYTINSVKVSTYLSRDGHPVFEDINREITTSIVKGETKDVEVAFYIPSIVALTAGGTYEGTVVVSLEGDTNTEDNSGSFSFTVISQYTLPDEEQPTLPPQPEVQAGSINILETSNDLTYTFDLTNVGTSLLTGFEVKTTFFTSLPERKEPGQSNIQTELATFTHKFKTALQPQESMPVTIKIFNIPTEKYDFSVNVNGKTQNAKLVVPEISNSGTFAVANWLLLFKNFFKLNDYELTKVWDVYKSYVLRSEKKESQFYPEDKVIEYLFKTSMLSLPEQVKTELLMLALNENRKPRIADAIKENKNYYDQKLYNLLSEERKSSYKQFFTLQETPQVVEVTPTIESPAQIVYRQAQQTIFDTVLGIKTIEKPTIEDDTEVFRYGGKIFRVVSIDPITQTLVLEVRDE